MLTRRQFLSLCCAGPLTAAWTRAEATDLDCLRPVPSELLRHDVVQAALGGLDFSLVWDVHAHLVGTGDSGGGAYADPRGETWLNPIERIRRKVMLAAACVDEQADGGLDRRYIARLNLLIDAFPPGFRMMLFAFEYMVDDAGVEQPMRSTFHTPDAYARSVAAQQPQRYGWVASIHPYRADALPRLAEAAATGAAAVKWLPSSMNIDPSSPRCDAFYQHLVELQLPLVVHCGEEVAAPGAGQHGFNNPLHVRRPLAAGVRVIVAHAASLGAARDIDRLRPGQTDQDAPRVASFDLFARLMDEPRWEGRLFADISAVFQRNRELAVQRALFERRHWHHRLLHGSDYPLPGIGLVYRLPTFVDAGWLLPEEADVLARLRPLNPLLFEFVLKRSLKVQGAALSPAAFETARVLARRGVVRRTPAAAKASGIMPPSRRP
jgi:mannonate dehydratase